MYYQILRSKILHSEYIAFMCFVWPSEQTVPFASYIINVWVFIIEVKSVYSAVHTESLCNIDTFCPLRFWSSTTLRTCSLGEGYNVSEQSVVSALRVEEEFSSM